MRHLAAETKSVTHFEGNLGVLKNEFEPTRSHETRFLAWMGIGHFDCRSRSERAIQQCELTDSVAGEPVVVYPRSKFDMPSLRLAHDVLRLLPVPFAIIEEPSDRNAHSPADGVERLNRGRRPVSLELAKVPNGRPSEHCQIL